MANVDPSEVQNFLGGIDYPASKSELVDYARNHGASNNVLQTIQGLDRDQFESPTDIGEAMREMM